MHWQRSLSILPLLISLSCGTDETPQTATVGPPEPSRSPGVEEDEETLPAPARDIDWTRSAALFIGVQTFHDGSDLEVRYAADDAVDLAWLFVHELALLEPERTALLLAGVPAKETSRKHLAQLKGEVTLVQDGRRVLMREECINAETIAAAVRAQAARVGSGGILIVSFAGHGLSRAGEHRLLTADASSSAPHGALLTRILEAIKAGRPERILLLIDACRNEPRGGVQWASLAEWRPQLPETFFQDIELRLTYAFLASTGPGRYAYSDDEIGNGYFTRAVIEGLRGNASSQPDGFVTVSNLAAYVSTRVGVFSKGFQVPESRISGLERLRIVKAAEQPAACEMLAPRPRTVHEPNDIAKIRIRQPELFATVLVCPSAYGTCFNQNPGAQPMATRAGELFELPIHYGGSGGRYLVRAALTTDKQYLRGEFEPVLASLEPNGVVHWCDPVEITFNPKRKGAAQ